MQYIKDIFHLPSCAYTVHEETECFPCLGQFPMLKYNFNMPYTMANMAYFNFDSEENKKEFSFVLILCIYLGDSCSRPLFRKDSLRIDGSLQMGCGGCDKMQIRVSPMLIQERSQT